MFFFEETDLGLKIRIKFPADTLVLPALRHKAFKPVFFVEPMPLFNSRRTDGCWLSVRSGVGFCGGLAEEFIVADRGIADSGFEWCDHAIPEEGNALFLI